ncbi:STAM-binding protein-like [Mesocricetus auratus]|uniref:STAM-binding protein-like n=1 Tax=Mesocricetus auratus TaxID=10036 RepID=A0ABM2X1K1_MESAU|nr:STAM-binding protein-like [Mesocricetus auratus]
MSGKIFEPWLIHQQSYPGLFTAMDPNEKWGAIRTYRDVTLPPQERFQILIHVGMNIEVSKKVPLKIYVDMKDDLIKVAADLQRKQLEEEAFVEYHKFLTLFVEKLREGPEYLNCLSKGTRSQINKTINRVFVIAETLKGKLLTQYNKEYEGYLADKKKREEEEAENKAFWKDLRNTIRNSKDFVKWSSLVERLVDGAEKDSGEVGSSLASASKSAEESLAESTPQEAYEEVTHNTSSDKQGGETNMMESPGNSPQVHDLERLM